MTFALITGDPVFDPNEPVTVNGFLYIPASRAMRARKPLIGPAPRRNVPVTLDAPHAKPSGATTTARLDQTLGAQAEDDDMGAAIDG